MRGSDLGHRTEGEAQLKANTQCSRLPTICIDNQELPVSHLFLAFGRPQRNSRQINK